MDAPLSIYRREFTQGARVTAKEAKDAFFLTTEDLSRLPHDRPSGWGSYFDKSGACKLFNARQIQAVALAKFGSADELERKAAAKKARRQNKFEKDQQKAREEEQRRREAAEAAEAARKQAALEKKLKAEETVRMKLLGQTLVSCAGRELQPSEIQQLLDDAQSWRAHVQSLQEHNELTETVKKRKAELSDLDNVLSPEPKKALLGA